MSKETVEQQDSAQMPSKKKRALIIIMIIIIAILIGVIIYLLWGERPYDRVVTPDNVDRVISDMEEEEHTPIGYYEVGMNTEWIFTDSKSVSTNAYVTNAESNLNPVYFTIALENDPDRVIYTSPLLLVGSSLDEIKLDEELEKGSYDCVLTYHLMDEEDNEQSTVSVSVNISIEN